MIRWFEKRNKLSWCITVLIAVVIFCFSSLSFEGVGDTYTKNWLSIVYHIVMFFFLCLFLLISLMKGEKKYLFFFLAILIPLSYGAIDELHQFFVPGRFCTVLDLGFDSIGILFASMFYFISIEYRKRL